MTTPAIGFLPTWTLSVATEAQRPRAQSFLNLSNQNHGPIHIATVPPSGQIIAAATTLYREHDQEAGLMINSRLESADLFQDLLEINLKNLRSDCRRVTIVQAIPADTLLSQILQKRGFESIDFTETWLLPLEEFAERASRVFHALDDRDSIPKGIRLVPPTMGWHQPVLDFLKKHKPQLISDFLNHQRGFLPQHSLAIWYEDRICGVSFSEIIGQRLISGFRLVHPDLRQSPGWVNALLLHFGLSNQISWGANELEFTSHPNEHKGTRLLAKQLKGTLLAHRDNFALEL